jgi:hypothetical protein
MAPLLVVVVLRRSLDGRSGEPGIDRDAPALSISPRRFDYTVAGEAGGRARTRTIDEKE